MQIDLKRRDVTALQQRVDQYGGIGLGALTRGGKPCCARGYALKHPETAPVFQRLFNGDTVYHNDTMLETAVYDLPDARLSLTAYFRRYEEFFGRTIVVVD